MKHVFENHDQWPAVKAACEKLNQHGFLTYLAGGCVRDFLMNRTPHDFDIATQATPEQVEKLFPNSLMVGRAFGVSIIPYDGFQLEIATFRKDGDYRDGRHPEGVIFADAKEDAKRRDFTVNALFYDLNSEQVIDHVDGLKDIKSKTLRAVGEPALRFTEDKLRLLRAVRFAAQLDFEIEPETWREVVRLAPEIYVVSRERVRDEIVKLLSSSERVRGLMLLRESGLIETLFPALGRALEEPEFIENYDHTFELFKTASDDEAPSIEAGAAQHFLRENPLLWLSLFFLDHVAAQGQRAPSALDQVELLNSLKIDHHSRDGIVWFWNQRNAVENPESLARLDRQKLLMSPWWGFTFSMCCVLNSGLSGSSGARESGSSGERDRVWREALELFEKQGGVIGQKLSPWITGKDLKASGISPGIEMGRQLEKAFEHQILGDWVNREEGLAWLRDLAKK